MTLLGIQLHFLIGGACLTLSAVFAVRAFVIERRELRARAKLKSDPPPPVRHRLDSTAGA